MRDVELEPIVAGLQRPIEQVADTPISVGERLGHPDRPAVTDVDPIERDVDPGRGRPLAVSRTWVLIVGRCSAAFAATLSSRHGDTRIDVGDLHFSARWEPEAPRRSRRSGGCCPSI